MHPLTMMLFVVFAWTANAPTPTLFCFVTFATLLFIKNVMVFPIFPKVNGYVEGVFKGKKKIVNLIFHKLTIRLGFLSMVRKIEILFI